MKKGTEVDLPGSKTPGFEVDEDGADDLAEGGSVNRLKLVLTTVLLVVRIHKTPGQGYSVSYFVVSHQPGNLDKWGVSCE